MKIITENIEHAGQLIFAPDHWKAYIPGNDDMIGPLIRDIFEDRALYSVNIAGDFEWSNILIIESSRRSHYDIVNGLSSRNIPLPHGVICLAGEGSRFHGFRDRNWAAPAGNIYLTLYLAPDQRIDNFGPGFLALAAVSVVDAIDNLPGFDGKAGIKWVNDILIDDCKVCGVLAHTQQEGESVISAVLGIGLNVLSTPEIDPTPYVPCAASLKDFLHTGEKLELTYVFEKLSQALRYNYRRLLATGHEYLVDKYRRRSMIINRQVEISLDLPGNDKQLLHKGIVEKIGGNLELYLKGVDKPIDKGRLILKKPEADKTSG